MRLFDRGKKCRFKLADVICPDQQHAVLQITPGIELSGEIVSLSDYGDQPDRFAIIEVEGIASPLIVPVERLQAIYEAQLEDAEPERAVHLDDRYERAASE